MTDHEWRERIVQSARRWIGTPYMHQASVQGIGCDCLGLVRGVWRDMYGDEPERLPAYSPHWAENSGQELLLHAAQRHCAPVDLKEIQAGDLLLFRWRANLPVKHAAIASSPDRMIHAHDGASVCEVAIAPFWPRKLVAAFAFPQQYML